MKDINIEEIINKLDDLNIIDIRDSYLYNIGKIPNSKNIPMNFLLMNPDNYLRKSEKYYIYCNYGMNSKKVCKELSNKGFDVTNINGGYNSYKLMIHKM
jgi:rhodanese-related sulfurtransferase